jgi:DNA-binding NarL/FixJ family response regulator
MNGYEFVKKIQRIQPETKVLLMSAFEINPNEFSNVLPAKIDGFISKPASLKQITNVVRSHMPSVQSTSY